MSLPTSIPNQVGARMVYPKYMDDNWGAYMNKNFEHLAERTDTLKLEVKDKAKDVELSVAAYFALLKDTLNKVAEDYSSELKAARATTMLELKADIDSAIASAVGEMLNVTKNQLLEIQEIKTKLILAITSIQTKYHLTEAYIEAGIDRILKALGSEAEASASAKDELVRNAKAIRERLVEHINDFDNPHEFNISQSTDSRPVYQPDINGNNALFPLDHNDIIVVQGDEDSVTYNDDLVDNSGDANIDTSALIVLHQHLLGKYLVLNDVPAVYENIFYRFGDNPSDVSGVEFTADRAGQVGGDVAIVTSDGGAPLQMVLEWDSSATNNNPGDYQVLVFNTNTPTVGSPVIVNMYAAGAPITASPILTVNTTIARLNYTNRADLLEAIITYIPPGESLDINNAILKLGNLSSPTLLHWSSDSSINPGVPLKIIYFTAVSQILSPDEIDFDIPLPMESLIGSSWRTVEAIGGSVGDVPVAIYYNSFTGKLHVILQPDSNNIVHEYTLEFANSVTPIVAANQVTIVHYVWNLTDAGSVSSNEVYSPKIVETGTAEVVI